LQAAQILYFFQHVGYLMVRQLFALMALTVSMTLAGCGGSNAPSLTAEKDELARWAEENPQEPLKGDEDEF